MKFAKVMFFTPVCHSVHGGSRSLSWRGLCPRRSLSRGSVSGGVSVRGVSVRGVSVQGVSVQGGLCHGDPLYGNERAVRILLECILVIINRFRSMVYMLNYPDVMKRCQSEIDEVIGRHRAPSMKDKASLPYVESTLLEIQRMTSIAPFGVCGLDTILNKNINNEQQYIATVSNNMTSQCLCCRNIPVSDLVVRGTRLPLFRFFFKIYMQFSQPYLENRRSITVSYFYT